MDIFCNITIQHVPLLKSKSYLVTLIISFSWKAIIHLDIMCNKVHFHIWNLSAAHQGTVQGSVHRVDNIAVQCSVVEYKTVQFWFAKMIFPYLLKQ